MRGKVYLYGRELDKSLSVSRLAGVHILKRLTEVQTMIYLFFIILIGAGIIILLSSKSKSAFDKITSSLPIATIGDTKLTADQGRSFVLPQVVPNNGVILDPESLKGKAFKFIHEYAIENQRIENALNDNTSLSKMEKLHGSVSRLEERIWKIKEQIMSTVDSANTNKEFAQVEKLLLELIEIEEADAKAHRWGVAPWAYGKLSALYKKQKRHSDEKNILERYAQQETAPGVKGEKLKDRLQTIKDSSANHS